MCTTFFSPKIFFLPPKAYLINITFVSQIFFFEIKIWQMDNIYIYMFMVQKLYNIVRYKSEKGMWAIIDNHLE